MPFRISVKVITVCVEASIEVVPIGLHMYEYKLSVHYITYTGTVHTNGLAMTKQQRSELHRLHHLLLPLDRNRQAPCELSSCLVSCTHRIINT